MQVVTYHGRCHEPVIRAPGICADEDAGHYSETKGEETYSPERDGHDPDFLRSVSALDAAGRLGVSLGGYGNLPVSILSGPI